MSERRLGWRWNQRWGGLSRRDVYLSQVVEDADHFIVELRHGGAEGQRRVWELPDKEMALLLYAELTGPDADFAGDWKDMAV